jgi:polyvinyl alcohol dehydrogenase (cytochrome)
MIRWGLCLLLVSAAFAQDGTTLFRERCAACHDSGASRAPRTEALRQLSPDAVYNALTVGKMAALGSTLSAPEIRAIAASLTGKPFGGAALPKSAYCTDAAPPLRNPLSGGYWNGWGIDLENHRSQPGDRAGLSAADVPRLKLKWAFAFPGATRAFSQPTVAGGRVFVGSASRKVYSLNASSGCVYWAFDADFPVRAAISIGTLGDGWTAWFGDQHGNAYAVDAGSGKLLWKARLDEHPFAQITGSPVLYGGRLYVPMSSWEEINGAPSTYQCCTFRGSLSALDAATGKVLWKTYTIADAAKPTKKSKAGTQLWGPSGAGVWSAPTIDTKKHAIYIVTGDSYSDPPVRTTDAFLGLDLDTGRILWSRQLTTGDAFNLGCAMPDSANCPDTPGPDFDFGQSAILVALANGKRALIAGQKSGVVHALDPDQQGEVLWSARIGKGGMLGGSQWGSAADAQNVYAAISDFGFKMVPAPTAHSTNTDAGPVEVDSAAGGGLFALRLSDGKRVWSAPPPVCGEKPGCSPAQSAAVTLIPGVAFSGSLDGHLRGYATQDGKVLWDTDTGRAFETVNGIPGNGGSIDGPGPVVAGGIVYVNSGYSLAGQRPGNVLLAYSVDGK